MALLALCLMTTTLLAAEKMNRGLVAFNTDDNTTFISWRYFDGEQNYTYRLYRNGVKMVETKRTSHTLPIESKPTDKYKLEVVSGGNVIDEAEVSPYSQMMKVALQKPDASVTNNSSSYTPNDISIGDVDNDGEMELFVKWDPEDSRDSGKNGKSSNCVIDCYKMNGTRLWSVNLGPNIRAGAHYTQMLVFDFNGDGRAEMICKTASWSKDGQGKYVSEAGDADIKAAAQNSKSFRNSNGHILEGPEFLTVFDGQTGAAIHTIWYNPDRSMGINKNNASPAYNSSWGDNWGNRGERYNACVAYLDGQDSNPTAILNRGYYTAAYIWAVDFDGSKLIHRWLHASVSKTKVEVYDANWNKTEKTYEGTATSGNGSNTMYGNGNHNISVADVDGDGCDEILFGSAACDNNGQLLYATGFGHGDAIHVGKMNPDRQGLQVFQVHEESPYGWDLHDAATGEILFSATADDDNGRGIAADVIGSNRGYEFCSAKDRQQRSAVTGNVVSTKSSSVNFRLYWDGTLQDCLADGGYFTSYKDESGNTVYTNELETYKITHWNGSAFETIAELENHSCNTTKRNPNLLCDLFGDWREEVILHDDNNLYIYSSAMPTNYKVPCLLTDHTYRLAIAWQMSSYNQPPHLGYYLPEAATTIDVSAASNETLFYDPNELAGEGVQHTEVGTGDILWTLSAADIAEQATYAETIGSYFTGSSLTMGSSLAVNGQATVGESNQTKFNYNIEDDTHKLKEGAASDGNAVTFLVTLKDDYEFQPTAVSFYATRYGTDGGSVDVTWLNGDGSNKKIATGISPERNNATTPYTKAEYPLNAYKVTTGTFGLRFNLYGITNNKQLGLGNVTINGTVFSTSATGIREQVSDVTLGGSYYNLQGVRVDRPTKGVYIQNGRKVVVK